MMWKSKSLKRIAGYVVLLLCIWFASVIPVQAGSGINDNESMILAVVQGVFLYNGKYYCAKQEYISQVYAYLDQDDVDLTATQANEVINRIYASVEQGINAGYLYELEEDTEEETTESGSTEEDTDEDVSTEDSSTEETSTDETDTDEPGTDENTTEEQTTEAVVGPNIDSTTESTDGNNLNSDVWNEMIGYQTKNQKKLSRRPDRDRKKTEIVKNDDGEFVVTVEEKQKTIEDIMNDYHKIIVGVFWSLIAGSVIVILLLLGILQKEHCMVWKKNKKRSYRKGHTRRKNIRKAARWILTGVSTIDLLLLVAILVMEIGLFSEESIMTNLNTSGYFQYSYEEYCDKETDEKLDYETYLFHSKNQILTMLHDKETESDLQDTAVIRMICEMRDMMGSRFLWMCVMLLLCIVASYIVMVNTDMMRYRGCRHITMSIIISSVITVLIALAMLIGKPYSYIYIEPDYLYLFSYAYCEWLIQIICYLGIFGGICGAALIGLYRSLRKFEN